MNKNINKALKREITEPTLLKQEVKMGCSCLLYPSNNSLFFRKTVDHNNRPTCFPSSLRPTRTTNNTLSSSSSSSCKVHSYNERNEDDGAVVSASLAYDILGVVPNCSPAQLKAAFRAKVKQFHPDVRKDGKSSDAMIRRVIEAYEILSNYSKSEIIERECLDPFDEPECEAFDLFVNEVLCIGRGCTYSCVERAPHAFGFSPSTGTACATSQGQGDDYQVQLAVGQCPRSCIHYVTPSQRIILEELLDGIMNAPYDTSAEAELLYSLIVKAAYENNRYQKPKKQPKVSTENVDWF